MKLHKRLFPCLLSALLLSALLLTACSLNTAQQAAAPPSPTPGREVSAAFQGFSQTGLEWIQAGGAKESGVPFQEEAVSFQDPAVERFLRHIVDKPEGTVLRSDLQSIHLLCWSHNSCWSDRYDENGNLMEWPLEQPQTLADLAYCDNLQWIRFGEMEVPSLQPLAGLSQLEVIEFEGAKVTPAVLEELALLPALKELSVGFFDEPYGTDWRGITDGGFLLPLADRLVCLQAAGGVNWNPEVLAQMTALRRLSLADAEDLGFLAELPALQRLYLTNCTSAEWGSLAALQNLEYLSVNGSQAAEAAVTLEDLRPLTRLQYLGLSYTAASRENTRQEIIDALPSLTGLYIF